MRAATVATVVASIFARAATAAEVDNMGPAAFLWPEDRVWAASADNNAPCGSVANAGNRTTFPMSNGRLALVAQNESAAIHIGVSYLDNPTSLSDFDIFLTPADLAELDVGHTCITIPDPPSNITSGANATFTMFYTLEDDASDDSIYYACADISYVEEAAFTTSIPCFNSTTEDPTVSVDTNVNNTVSSDDSASKYHSSSELSAWGVRLGSSGISKGAIAGAVVGSVVGAAALAGAGFWFWRRRKAAQAAQAAAVSPAMAQKQWDVENGSDSTSQRS